MGSDEEEREIAEQVGKSLAEWEEAKAHLERETALYHALRRERNYQVLQAAAVIYGSAIVAGLDPEKVKRQKVPMDVFVDDALTLLEEIESRNP